MTLNTASDSNDPLVGREILGRFLIVRRLAAGGMGVVYEAEQKPLGRRVALKILETSKTPHGDASFKERFFLEANAAAKLAHPNTIVVHDYGTTEDGLCFIAMEFLGGATLSQRLKDGGPLSPPDAIHVAMQIASSLRGAHEQELVHRDLKPGNVMFAPRGGDPNFVKVLDFGLVKVLGDGKEDLQLTQSGVMMGSPRYMAPEQVKAQPCDARTDIYSFGAVLYHMLTGAPPFHAGSAFEAMQHHCYTQPAPLRETWPGCQAGPVIEGIALRCLQKEPAHRFQSMGDVMDALRDASLEAGGGASGVGSYLGASSVSSSSSGADSGPQLPPPASAPNIGSGPQSGIVDRRAVPAKTMRLSDLPAPPVGAAVSPSGISPSGISPSGISPSGISLSGISLSGISPSGISPSGISPSGISPSGISQSGISQSGMTAPPGVAQAPAPAPARRNGGALRFVLGVAAAMLAIGVAVAVTVIVMGLRPDGVASSDPPSGTGAERASAERASAERASAERASAEPEPAGAEPVGAEPVGAQVPLLTLNSDPVGATVRRDGSDLGDTPLDLQIPDGQRWTVVLVLAGHEPRTITLQGGHRTINVQLEPLEQAPPSGRRGRRAPVRPHVPVAQPLGPSPSPPRTTPTTPTPYAPDLNDPWARRGR